MKYNDRCRALADLIAKGNAPAGAVAPKSLNYEEVITLDVDSDMWVETGLVDDEETSRWMRDEQIRKGIKWLQLKDRCVEEQRRLKLERHALQHWFSEEWEKHQAALVHAGISSLTEYTFWRLTIDIDISNNVTMSFAVDRKLRSLRGLFHEWEPTLRGLWESDEEVNLPKWGPEFRTNIHDLNGGTAISAPGATDDDDMDMHTDYGDEGDVADGLQFADGDLEPGDVGLGSTSSHS